MSESAKAVLALIMILGMIASAWAWTNPEYGLFQRVGFPVGTAVVVVILVWALVRKDQAPDFLREIAGGYYERGGFCFAILLAVREGVCLATVYYQNRYSRSCRARVFIQPTRKFWLNRGKLPSLSIRIACEAAAFGRVYIPWGIPSEFQGKRQVLDISARRSYGIWRGRMVRFQDGMHVGPAPVALLTQFATVFGALGGLFVRIKSATLEVELPTGVAETVTDDGEPDSQTLWRPGDAARCLQEVLACHSAPVSHGDSAK